MKILVVDDEFVSRKKMEKIMMEFGESVPVESGKEAVESFAKALDENKPFNLITLDIEMPDMNGTETLQKVRRIEKELKIQKEDQVKILMVTAHSQKEYVINSVQSGCNGYIVKPFEKQTIIKKLFDLHLPIPLQSL